MKMETFRPSQVPEYLRNSKFFLQLSVDDDDEFSIPANHTKLSENVNTLPDMTELLNTIRFWGLGDFPQAMIDFAARQPYTEIKAVLEPYKADLRFISIVCSIVSEAADGTECLERAMESGDLEVVKYFYNRGEPFSKRAIALAAGRNALDCLEYVMSDASANHYCYRTSNDVYSEAVRNGCMESILYLRRSGFPVRAPFLVWFRGEGVDLVKIAASCGQCDVLKYLHKQGCFLSSAAIAAADAGYFDCLEYAVNNGALLLGEDVDDAPRGSLAQRLDSANLLKLLALAMSDGSEPYAQTALTFAKSSNWESFKLSVYQDARPSIDLLVVAITCGNVACWRHLHQVCVAKAEASEQGCNWLTYAASIGNSNSSGRLRPIDLAPLAAKAHQWDCLRFLITHECPVHKSFTTVLVQAGQLELYHLAVAHGCEVSVQAACYFARDGNLSLLQHALEHGCERSEEILRVAARHGQLPCLEYAHAQGCPWSAQVTIATARGGHQECLLHLKKHGCPSNARTRALKRKRADTG